MLQFSIVVRGIFRGGGVWATSPPLLPGQEKLLNKNSPFWIKNVKKILGRSTAPCPNLSPVGGDTPQTAQHLKPCAFGTHPSPLQNPKYATECDPDTTTCCQLFHFHSNLKHTFMHHYLWPDLFWIFLQSQVIRFPTEPLEHRIQLQAYKAFWKCNIVRQSEGQSCCK